MTEPVETIVGGPATNSEFSTVVSATPFERRLFSDHAILDDSWADEFDRRLAAWEAESPSTAPTGAGKPTE